MTGRHAGLSRPADIHRTDQLAGWLTEFDAYSAGAYGWRDIQHDQAALYDWHLMRHEQVVALACKARLLIDQVVNGG
jgi:hypothetical protein